MTSGEWLLTIFLSGVMAVLMVVAIVSVIPNDPRSPEVKRAHDEWRH